MPAWIEGCAAAAVAFGGALTKTIIDRRRRSGTVATSDAGELWKEAKDIRDFLNERVGELKSEVDSLTERVDLLTDANDGLRFQLEQAKDLVVLLKAEREELTAELDRARSWGDVLVEELKRHDLALPLPPKRRT